MAIPRLGMDMTTPNEATATAADQTGGNRHSAHRTSTVRSAAFERIRQLKLQLEAHQQQTKLKLQIIEERIAKQEALEKLVHSVNSVNNDSVNSFKKNCINKCTYRTDYDTRHDKVELLMGQDNTDSIDRQTKQSGLTVSETNAETDDRHDDVDDDNNVTQTDDFPHSREDQPTLRDVTRPADVVQPADMKRLADIIRPANIVRPRPVDDTQLTDDRRTIFGTVSSTTSSKTFSIDLIVAIDDIDTHIESKHRLPEMKLQALLIDERLAHTVKRHLHVSTIRHWSDCRPVLIWLNVDWNSSDLSTMPATGGGCR